MNYSAFLLISALSTCLSYPMVVLRYRQNCPCKGLTKIELELWEINQFWTDSILTDEYVTNFQNYTWRQINLQRTSSDPWGNYEMEAYFKWYCCETWQPASAYRFQLKAPLGKHFWCLTTDKECKYEITLQPVYHP